MFDSYLRHSDQFMFSLFACMDHAHAAEKLFDAGNLGADNSAWKTGPAISSPSNCPQLSHEHPYCMLMSNSLAKLLFYQVEPNRPSSKPGAIPIGNDSQRIKSTEIIPTVSVGIQFAILEAFDFDAFNEFKSRNGLVDDLDHVKRYDRRPVGSRMESLFALTDSPEDRCLVNAYKSVSAFRNELVHEPDVLCTSPEVAFDVYSLCQAIAFAIANLLGTNLGTTPFQHRVSYWRQSLDRFTQVAEF